MSSVVSIEIAATPTDVWERLVDFERWPEWLGTTGRVKRLDHGLLSVGSRYEVDHDGEGRQIWTVIELEDGRSLTIKTGTFLMGRSVRHDISATDGGSRVTFTARNHGPGSWPLSWLFRGYGQSQLQAHAETLKRVCEQ